MSTQMIKKNIQQSRRGDTLIEVMFAIAVFSLVAVLSVSMMNLGLANSEGALELVTARNELNAQAEALRFVHSSYLSERSLPLYAELTPAQRSAGEKYRQYQEVWNNITGSAVESMGIEYPLNNCADVYAQDVSGKTPLQKNNAFVLNTRDLSLGNPANKDGGTTKYIYIGSNEAENKDKFRQAQLSARIIYSNQDGDEQNFENNSTSIGEGTRAEAENLYNYVAYVEGIWVVAVKGPDKSAANPNPQYYDFYIETCWNPPNSIRPTSLDTVIRLYNPE